MSFRVASPFGKISIAYTDLFGDQTERAISDIEVEEEFPEDAGRLINAFCHLRQERRVFNISRIVVLMPQGKEIDGLIYFKTAIEEINAKLGIQYDSNQEIASRNIALKIKTRKQLADLEQKCSKAELAYLRASDQHQEKKTHQTWKILEKVLWRASLQYYEFQYIPALSLYTSLIQLQHAYILCSPGECRILRNAHSELSDKNDWTAMCAHHEPMSPRNSKMIDALKEFRIIIESQNPDMIKLTEINRLVMSRPAELGTFFHLDSDLSPGDQWFVGVLLELRVPRAATLYRAGYTTLEKCLSAGRDELLNLKGFGPKSFEKLRLIRKEASHNNC